EIPDVEGDAEHVRGAAGVARVLERAAASGAAAIGRGVAGQREMDAGDLVTSVDRSGGGHRRVHPARHGGEYPHQPDPPATALTSPAARARSTTGPIASPSASTSERVEV